MRFKLIACLLVISLFSAQTISAVAQVVSPVAPVQEASGTMTIPAGTVVPLTLVTPVKKKSTKVGDTVRAQVAFPVTIGSHLLIPAGTYVEGTVVAIAAKKTKTDPGGLQLHFTRLIYANGYSVNLEAVNSHAGLVTPGVPFTQEGVGVGIGAGAGIAMTPVSLAPVSAMLGQAAPAPALPPLPGPPKGFIIGIAIAGAVAIGFTIWAIASSHGRAAHNDFVLYDSGYQFQMTLTTTLSVDAGQVSAAAALAPQ